MYLLCVLSSSSAITNLTPAPCLPLLLLASALAESGARDTLNYRVLPAFTNEEATELLAHHLYFHLQPDAYADKYPPATAVAEIKEAYTSTFAFLIGALGTRARTLALSIDNLSGRLLPDKELLLPDRGVPIPGA